MCIVYYHFRVQKVCQSLFAYTYVHNACSILRVCMTSKQAAYAYRKRLWTPATFSWQLFVHFRTRKPAASVGLRHARLNVSVGLSDAYATLSFLLRLFFNPHPRGSFWSLTARGLIAFFDSWARLRVRTNSWTLGVRLREVSSRILGLLSKYCTVHNAHAAFLNFLDSFKHISQFLRL